MIDSPPKYYDRLFKGDYRDLPTDLHPVLGLGGRIYVDSNNNVHVCPPMGEPYMESKHGVVKLSRVKRDVTFTNNQDLLWRILQFMDGINSISDILKQFCIGDHRKVVGLLADFANIGLIDISGRPISRFMHSVTKKGVLPNLSPNIYECLDQVADGNYRSYSSNKQIYLNNVIPKPLKPFYNLTRKRRSYRNYIGKKIKRFDFDAILNTACGITGSLEWSNYKLNLRSYPSSGGLYSVEVYPIVFAVEELSSAVYHLLSSDNVLEMVKDSIDLNELLDIVLPPERKMISGISAIICLTGVFDRHEYKYGQGGYRMMIAEAGHISQNIILAATSLGLQARPFGGMFDELLNRYLNLNTNNEQFILSVLLGYANTDNRC